MVILEYNPIVGGAQRQLEMLAPYLQTRGVEIHVLTRRYEGLAAYEELNGVAVHRLAAPRPKAVASLAYTTAVLNKIRQLKPDLIHAYSFLSPLSAAALAKQFYGIPVVAKVLRGGALGDVARIKRRRFGTRRMAFYRQKVDAFIAISQEIDQELAGASVPRTKRIMIPNGVDVNHFRPAVGQARQDIRRQLGLPNAPIVIFTGRLEPEKRVDHLLELWPAVRRSNADATLLILGVGSEAERLQRQAGPGVRFLGRIGDVAPYLRASDIFVLPSYTEGLSNALLEAMACGLAVIATEVGGATDVIAHQENGWLVPPDQPAELQTAVEILLGTPDTGRQMGKRAREKMARDFALPTIAGRLRHLYDQVLSGALDRPPAADPRGEASL